MLLYVGLGVLLGWLGWSWRRIGVTGILISLVFMVPVFLGYAAYEALPFWLKWLAPKPDINNIINSVVAGGLTGFLFTAGSGLITQRFLKQGKGGM